MLRLQQTIDKPLLDEWRVASDAYAGAGDATTYCRAQSIVCWQPSLEAARYIAERATSLLRSGSPSWREVETHHIVCEPAPPMFAYYYDAFGNGGGPSCRLLCKTPNTKLTVMSFVCFIRAARFVVSYLFLSK